MKIALGTGFGFVCNEERLFFRGIENIYHEETFHLILEEIFFFYFSFFIIIPICT